MSTDSNSSTRYEPHSFQMLCWECFKWALLGTCAFKCYLLIAWFAGTIGFLLLQFLPGAEGDPIYLFFTAFLVIYLICQLFGFVAVCMENEMILIPYTLLQVIIFAGNSCIIGFLLVMFFLNFSGLKMVHGPLDFSFLQILICLVVYVYNSLCLASAVNLIYVFETKRILKSRRRREEARRLMDSEDQPVSSVNIDTPPEYSSLFTCSPSSNTPPPGYSQLNNYENVRKEEEDVEKTSHRSLFKN